MIKKILIFLPTFTAITISGSFEKKSFLLGIVLYINGEQIFYIIYRTSACNYLPEEKQFLVMILCVTSL